MTGKGGSRAGEGGRVRPTLANPYGLGTWSGTGAPAEAAPEPPRSTETGSTDPRSPEHRPAEARPPGERRRRGPQVDADRGGPSPVPGEVLFDPPELPSLADPFELARRTVNRSRAAARDRGLFPISAKTQARDVRDRSGRAPGYSGSRPDPRDPQGIENVLKKVLGNLGWNAGMSAGRVLEEWDDIVGERLATHCRPVSFDEGVLVVSASSSAWAAQLRMLTPQLITTIEERVGSHVISELTVTGPAAAQRSWKKGRRTVTWRGPRDTYG
ncbi:RNA-binding protein [Brachybacterium vulturis]|uniref:RNA-binding protein n=1 Tax=Brachybacterium vulturis TaxID=2017484 RepID=A0A291GKT6_9MICO|nr:DciA family protein [Brachybacterium vulturis]ATG50564.1 RNA-binding protein [Brachybacterium vulturis]